MKAIETRYAGCRFRSRLEARWAVFFDTLGIKWEYEPQGFDLDGDWYLPDFWLPQTEVWVEIKGARPTTKEISKLTKLAEQVCSDKHRCRLLVGDIPRNAMVLGLPLPPLPYLPSFVPVTTWVPITGPGVDQYVTLPENPEDPIEVDIRAYAGIPAEYWTVKPMAWVPGFTVEAIDEALTAARSARFEHGVSG